jgi:glycosyltransferase involved in cell wall biosynthesis
MPISATMVMNIMEIVSGAGVNGAVSHCLLLTRQLARRGHQVTLVCPPEAWIARQLAADPVEVIASDLRRWPTGELRRVAAIARQGRVEVVHTHMSRAHAFGVLLRWIAGVPCVATAQSRHVQLHWMFNDRVIAVSDAARRFHRTYNLVRADRIVTIPDFVDCDRFARVPGDAGARFRASIKVDARSPLVGVVGPIAPSKGQLSLVRAMPGILAAVPEARLVLVGGETDEEYLDQVQSTAESLGVGPRVIRTGHRDDVPQALAAMTVVAVPSHEEGLPRPVLEAMAASRPVVATTVGGIPECVRPGKTGLLVPPGHVDALGAAVTALLRDPDLRRQYGEAARRRVRERFSPESQTARIEAVLASLIPRARAA